MQLSKNVQSRKRILVVAAGKTKWGAGYRFSQLNLALAEHFEVQTFFPNQDDSFVVHLARAHPNRLSSLLNSTPAWARNISRTAQQKFDSELSETISRFSPNLVIFSGTAILPYLNYKLDIPTVIDAYDLKWVVVQRTLLADGTVSIKRRLRVVVEGTLAKWYEKNKHALAAEIWVCSGIERTKVIQNGYAGSVKVLPNFFSKQSLSTASNILSKQKPIILFIGTMGYTGNRDGVGWFLRNSWPLIHQRLPEAEFWVVGPWPDWAIPSKEYHLPSVKLLGFIEALESLWEQASVFVCPLRIGSGTRIKIIEAWSHGIPVVSTSVGIEGLNAQDGVNACIVDDPNQFANSVLMLMSNPHYAQSIGHAGFNFWREHYTGEAIGKLAVRYCLDMFDSR